MVTVTSLEELAEYQTEGNRYAPGMQYYEELYDISLTPNELNFIRRVR